MLICCLAFTEGLENENDDTNFGQSGSRLPGSSSSSSRNTGAAAASGVAGATGASTSLSAAERREQERKAAYEASTGSLSQGTSAPVLPAWNATVLLRCPTCN